MTTPSQFDPLAKAPRSLRDRIVRKFGRTVEPLAMSLLAWCRALDHRIETVERRAEGVENLSRAIAQTLERVESVVSRLEEAGDLRPSVAAIGSANDLLATKVKDLETRADQAYWGREALVERMNQDDAREGELLGRLAAVEARAEELFWGRTALIERMNREDAVVEVIDGKVEALKSKVDEQLPLPLAFGLDYLAMGRRLAAIEDQLEAIVTRPGAATLVAFPGQEKAAG